MINACHAFSHFYHIDGPGDLDDSIFWKQLATSWILCYKSAEELLILKMGKLTINATKDRIRNLPNGVESTGGDR